MPGEVWIYRQFQKKLVSRQDYHCFEKHTDHQVYFRIYSIPKMQRPGSNLHQWQQLIKKYPRLILQYFLLWGHFKHNFISKINKLNVITISHNCTSCHVFCCFFYHYYYHQASMSHCKLMDMLNALVQDCGICSADALEIPQSCTKSSIFIWYCRYGFSLPPIP